MANIQKIDSELATFVDFLHNNNNEIKSFLEDIYLIRLEVAGLYYAPGIDEIFPKLEKGCKLELFREKNNEYDEMAILVKYDGKKIGYVPRKHNLILANLMDGGKELYGIVEDAYIDGFYQNDSFKVVEFKIYLKE